jgi:tRNA threonylcarbamoyladenosine biosynthesis protein TsaB
MLKLLALDTSTEYCSLALWLDDEVRARDVHVGQGHSEALLAMVRELLAEGGVKLAQLDGIAFGSGPGSFTGLRIACGVAQGLAEGAGLPVAGVSTLMALAEGSGARRVIACLDARMGEVYHAAYQRTDKGWQTLHAPGLYAPGDVPGVEGGDWTGCGSGFAVAGEVLGQKYAGKLARVDSELRPRAEFMARIAAPILAAGQGSDPAEALPLYVRDKVALKTSERA